MTMDRFGFRRLNSLLMSVGELWIESTNELAVKRGVPCHKLKDDIFYHCGGFGS